MAWGGVWYCIPLAGCAVSGEENITLSGKVGSIRAPESWWASLAVAADHAGLSLNAYIISSVTRAMAVEDKGGGDINNARVAKLADAPDLNSGTTGRSLQVRPLPRAPSPIQFGPVASAPGSRLKLPPSLKPKGRR